MKKICFVSYTNLYLVPYIKNYIACLEGTCDVIVWNRHDVKDYFDKCNIIEYSKVIKDNQSSKLKKIKAYLGYTRFVRQHISNNKYDVIIFLQSVGALFCTDMLLRKYKSRYIIDVRDYSIEGNMILKKIEGILFDYSCLNVISSKGYCHFLPKNKTYQLVHNYFEIDPTDIKDFKIREKPKIPLRLSYIGLIRFHNQNKKIIDLFSNDERFIVSFIGKNANELSDYISKKSSKNIILIDQFSPEETLKFYKRTDAILNVYGNNTPLLDYALSNKLYYAATLNIPIIVSKGTYMEKISLQNGFGFVLDFEDINIKEKLIEYILNRDMDVFEKKCDIFMKNVSVINADFSKKIKEIIN